MTTRIRLLALLFLLSVIAILARLFFWQIVKGAQLSEQGRLQHFSDSELPEQRGNILASDGTWLAASVDAWKLYAIRDQIPSPTLVAHQLAPILVEDSGDKKEVKNEENRIKGLLSNDKLVWIALKDKLSTNKKKNIEALGLDGLTFELGQERYYPEGSSSAHLLGFVGKDDEGHDTGYFGLEGYYNTTLASLQGYTQRESNALGAPIIVGDAKHVSALKGVDLVTHIDKRIQIAAEEKLKKGLETYGANQGTVVVMDAKNGGIIAMAAEPSYDPAKYADYGDSYFRNAVVSDSYEPGSIFKPLVMAAALDAGVIEPDTKCDICDKPYKVDKYYIKTWNNEYHPDSTMTDVIVHSDNVGMVFVGNKLGADKLYDYLDKYGFGRLTGIDLQGEFAPKLRDKGTWNSVDLATTTFGQGISVTPIQMVKAIGTIANGGVPVVPRVVDKYSIDDWSEDVKPQYEDRVISKKAADEITKIMVEAVKNGEAKRMVPKGYVVAGKTGTAQIAVSGHYDEEKTFASFVGFAPPSDPKFVMLVTLREPQTSQWASETAAPLWFSIAEDVFKFLGIAPSN